jgi:heme-degrading monooxygenase HmoA
VSASEHVIVWSFRIEPRAEAKFVAAYGADGAWAELFRKGQGYRGTQLIRCDEPGRFITIDRWDSGDAFRRFRDQFEAEYDALDERLADLIEIEACVAVGDAV